MWWLTVPSQRPVSITDIINSGSSSLSESRFSASRQVSEDKMIDGEGAMVEYVLDELLNITLQSSSLTQITFPLTSYLSQTKHRGVLRMRRNQTDPSIQCFRGPSLATYKFVCWMWEGFVNSYSYAIF